MIATEYLAHKVIGVNSGTYAGGLAKLYYTFRENIATFPTINPATQTILTAPVLAAGKYWYGPINLPVTLMGYDEKSNASKAGIFYKTTIPITQPGQNFVNDINIENLLYHEVIAVAKLRSGGFYKIFGTEKKGMIIETETDIGFGSRAITINKYNLTWESPIKAPVLANFLGDDSDNVGNNGGASTNDYQPLLIPFNTNGDTVINFTTEYINLYSNYPVIETWALSDDGHYYRTNISVDAVNNPPTQFIVRNNGGNGFIKII